MTDKSKPTSLVQTIAQNTIGLIITAIFSMGLVSGSGYLLFDSKDELNKMAQINVEIEKSTAEIKLGYEMGTIYGSGWFSNMETATQLGSTIASLRNNLPNDDLDDTFAEATITWSYESFAQLTSEKEQISGYVFGNKTILQSQAALQKVYGTHIEVVQGILELVNKWDFESLEERQSQFSSLHLKLLDASASVDALNSSTSQMQSDIEIAMKQSDLKLDEMKDNYNSISTRIWLSTSGVIIGLVLLVASLMYLAAKSLRPKLNVSNNVIQKPKQKRGER